MAESKAARVAEGWSSRKQRHEGSDLKGLPENVQEAILDLERLSHDIAERVDLAEQLWAIDPDHELALEPGEHGQTTWAQRFEVVGGEVLEITKESHDSPVKITYRPDLFPASEVDPRAALEARFNTPVEE